MTPERKNVLWLDDRVPANLQIVLRYAGCEIVPMPPDEVDPERQNPLAVFLPVTRATEHKCRGRLARLIVPTLDVGAIFIAVVMDDANQQEVRTQVMHLVTEKDKDAENWSAVFPGLYVERYDEARLAQLVRDARPGALANHNLDIQGLTPDSEGGVDSGTRCHTTKVLFRRAFANFDRIRLTALDGGRSPTSRVWKVRAHRGTECCEPFVAKFAARPALENERDAWRAHVLDFVPFPFRSPFVEDGLVRGATYGLLVSRLASGSQRLDEYVGVVKSPELSIVSLFEGALRNWRRNSAVVNDQLGRMYVLAADKAEETYDADRRQGLVQKNVLPGRSKLVDAYKLARTIDSQVSSPDQLWEILLGLPALRYRQCKAHGDLNTRNIFVRWNGVDVILIDFSHSGDVGPMSRDPSRLEVSLSFDVAVLSQETEQGASGPPKRIYAGRMLATEILEKLYKPPLLPPSWLPGAEDGRTDAIRQIRAHAVGEGISNVEYSITTACHLLRYARGRKNTAAEFSDAEVDRLQGLSYTLACSLIRDVHERLAHGVHL